MSDAVATTGILVQRADYAAPITIVSSSVASPTSILTSTPHGLTSGDSVTITGHTGSTPSINGTHVATVVDPTHFTIPVNVTVGGTGGSFGAVTDADFATIGEITKATPPGYSRNKIETSTHNEGRESFILGILRQKDPGFSINYVADNQSHMDIVDDILNNVKAFWRFKFPSGVRFTGPGYVQQFNISDAPVDAAQQADIVLAWAGAVEGPVVPA